MNDSIIQAKRCNGAFISYKNNAQTFLDSLLEKTAIILPKSKP